MALTGESRHCRFGKFEFWAERGMVTLVDTEAAGDANADVTTYTWRIPPGEFMKRCISAMIAEPDKYADKLSKLRKLLEDAKDIAKVAKAYGDPSDPSVLEHVIRHQKKHASLILPGDPDLPPMPGLPALAPKYKIDGRGKSSGDILTRGVDVVPDFSISPADMRRPAKPAKLIRS